MFRIWNPHLMFVILSSNNCQIAPSAHAHHFQLITHVHLILFHQFHFQLKVCFIFLQKKFFTFVKLFLFKKKKNKNEHVCFIFFFKKVKFKVTITSIFFYFSIFFFFFFSLVTLYVCATPPSLSFSLTDDGSIIFSSPLKGSGIIQKTFQGLWQDSDPTDCKF